METPILPVIITDGKRPLDPENVGYGSLRNEERTYLVEGMSVSKIRLCTVPGAVEDLSRGASGGWFHFGSIG